MFVLIVFLSYLLGFLSTLLLLIFLYIRFGLSPPVPIDEHEQYHIIHPLSENDHGKNSAANAVNYLVQFLFQELKDTAALRRYLIKKFTVELNELKRTKLGTFLLKDIMIRTFSIGRQCPIFSDIRLERYEHDERHLIKEFVAKLHVDYKDGFAVMLDIGLIFGYQCQLYIKLRRLKGDLHLEFRREPFSHWLVVFQKEPFVDFEIKAYLSNRQSVLLATIISQQIRRSLQKKQTWPSYKIRYQPFFPNSKKSIPQSISATYPIRGKFDVSIKYCDRLSIPSELFSEEKSPLLSVLLTLSINEQMCKDYLHLSREQWPRREIDIVSRQHQLRLREVIYMDHNEVLIEELNPLPDDIRDAMEDQNLFLLEVQGQTVKTLEQAQRLLTPSSSDEPANRVMLVIGMPLLNSVRMPRVIQSLQSDEMEDVPSTSVSTTATSETLRKRTPVRPVESDNPSDNRINESETIVEQSEVPQRNAPNDEVSLTMINKDLLQTFQAELTPTRKAEPYVEFDDQFEFQLNSNEGFLNVCLWCQPPPDCGISTTREKLILLGYATASLSDIVLDAHMSFQRETQVRLNFRSASPSRITSKKHHELTQHKGYDDNMAHGFVTLNIKHRPEIRARSTALEKRDSAISETFFSVEIPPWQAQTVERPTNEDVADAPLASKSTNHLFEDQKFLTGAPCIYCKKKAWMTGGRQCRHCSLAVHKKCEDKLSIEHCCTPPSTLVEEDSPTTTSPLVNRASAVIETATIRSLRMLANKNFPQLPPLTLSELAKAADQADRKSSGAASPRREGHSPTSSKLANAASSAYSKFFDLKSKRLPSSSSAVEGKKNPQKPDSRLSENISTSDLQDIISTCLSDEPNESEQLKQLLHETAVDHTVLYAKANALAPELFREIPIDQRKEKLDQKISRLQEEIQLQERIRDELVVEHNSELADANEKRKLQARITNVDEKVQALGALFILYCSGVQYCCAQMEMTHDRGNSSTGEKINGAFDENATE